MTVPSLQWPSAGNNVSVDDERGRSKYRGEMGDETWGMAIASITFTGADGDEQWGEFLTHDEAAALHACEGMAVS